MARKSEFRQVQPVAEKHEQPDQNKCRSDDRIAVFADDFLQGVGVRPFAQQGNECQPDPRIRENSPGSVEQSVAENTYGHEIEMYTVEQGEKRDKRQ